MNTDNFINELAYVLEVSSNEITMNDELNKFKAWDSLAMMTFVVVFRDKTKKEIDPMQVLKCLKVSDLLELVS
jgi:acyl carrier protein